MTDVLRKLELQPVAGNITSIRSIVAAHMIDTSHFNPSAARVANRIKRREWTVETALVERSKVPRSSLSTLIKKFGVLEYKCVECNCGEEWNNKPLTLTVDHINGINDDNRIDNLRYLCPNCHSQTETFGGKNR